ncbi:hypothetical protein [Burkholderia cenocepacia]|uniref:hypothetical protein n=1 Tax=Burkholderia cenocepacia TaxID=95486 RepID=UPI002230ADA0|nr:hypothetical protein [Burkholderia cenocepacia]MCW3541733.1 hypothetical protein [Burkholderia cenocepacia]MEB2495752.1 hypothetical protein [Burkholderia cenocepacia]MEB2553221.1 hypothetical protein [Burkholderia cenocepacia]
MLLTDAGRAFAPARLSPKLFVHNALHCGLAQNTVFLYSVCIHGQRLKGARLQQTLLIIAKDDSWKIARRAPG